MQRVARKRLLAAAAASGAFVAVAGGVAHADSGDGGGADGTAAGSPGVVSGNAVAVPLDVPVNACGNGLHVVGLLNPAAGGTCANADAPTPPPPTPRPRVIPPEPPRVTVPPTAEVAGTTVPVRPPAPRPSTPPAPQGERLAETGAETTGLAVAGIAFLLGGTILYRRAGAVRA